MTIKEAINKVKHCGVEEIRLAMEQIEKKLEVLDILKKHHDNNSLALSLNSFIVFTIHKDDKDFNKIKEWIENDTKSTKNM